MREIFERVGDGVTAVDTEFIRPRMDASHLIVDAGRAAFVDTGTHFSTENLLAALTAQDLGVSYRELDTAAGAFIFPTTSPSQFDPAQLHASIDRILEYKPTAAYLTHYSRVEHLEELAVDLHSDIDAFVRIAESLAHAPDRIQRMERPLFEHLAARLAVHGFSGDAARQHAMLDGDVTLNAAGLHAWLSRRRA